MDGPLDKYFEVYGQEEKITPEAGKKAPFFLKIIFYWADKIFTEKWSSVFKFL